MRGINSATVDLIYLDPPFNSNANYAAPIGSKAAGAEFKDTWTLSDIDIEWLDVIEKPHPNLWRVLMAAMRDSDKSYLIYMAIRLLEMKRLLKPTGSIYLHCDPTMSHYLKLVMDAIFGRASFLGDVIWNKQNGVKAKSQWGKENDNILCYATTLGKHVFNSSDPVCRKPYSDLSLKMHFKHVDSDGRRYRKKTVGGKDYVYYEDEGRFLGNLWDDIPSMKANTPLHGESTGFKTQKPLELLHRIIRASSNEGDMVFDPFCGCATTCVAAHNYGRNWVGIDISPKAAHLVVERISENQGSLYKDIIHREDVPRRTDLGPIPKYNCKENKDKLYGKQGGYCAGPRCKTHFEPRHLEVDHIIAKSKGGTDHIDNLQLLCGHCNSVKGNRGMKYLRERLRLAA